MNQRVLDDLARWEQGKLTGAELELLHPREGIGGLVSLHTRLAAFSALEVGDAEPGWEALRRRLPGRLSTPKRPLGTRVTRPLVVAAAAALLTGSLAYAAGVEPVRRSVDDVLNGISRLFAGADSPNHGAFSPDPIARGGPPSPADDHEAGSHSEATAESERDQESSGRDSGASANDNSEDAEHEGKDKPRPDEEKADDEKSGRDAKKAHEDKPEPDAKKEDEEKPEPPSGESDEDGSTPESGEPDQTTSGAGTQTSMPGS